MKSESLWSYIIGHAFFGEASSDTTIWIQAEWPSTACICLIPHKSFPQEAQLVSKPFNDYSSGSVESLAE